VQSMSSAPTRKSWQSGVLFLFALISIALQVFASGVTTAAGQNSLPAVMGEAPLSTAGIPAPVGPGAGPWGTPFMPTAAFIVDNNAWNAEGVLFFFKKGGGGVLLAEKRNFNAPPPQFTLVESITDDCLNDGLRLGYRIRIGLNAASPTGFEVGFLHLPRWEESSGELGYEGGNFQLTSVGLLQPQFAGVVESIEATQSTRLYSIEMNATRDLGPATQGLLGARYVRLEDSLGISGLLSFGGPLVLDETKVDTRVDMLGVQVGAVHSMMMSGLAVELNVRAGVFASHNVLTMKETVYAAIPIPLDVSGSRIALGGLLDGRIAARISFSGSSSLFCGYQFFFLNGVALAPQQLALLGGASNSTPARPVTDTPGGVSDRSGMALHGFFAGVHMLW